MRDLNPYLTVAFMGDFLVYPEAADTYNLEL